MYGIPQKHKKLIGKEVQGAGTGTSDSVAASVPTGSYIVPSDTAQAVKGFGVPGYKSPDQQLQLSDGEQELSPKQVHGFGVKVLNLLKGSTHEQVPDNNGGGAKTFFANGGLVDDPEKKQSSFDMTNTPAAGRGVPGYSQRAQQMQSQAQQPVTGPRGVVPTADKPAQQGFGVPRPDRNQSSLLNVPVGVGKAVGGAFGLPVAAGRDALRVAGASLAGGDPDTLEGGRAKYRDEAVGRINEGAEQVGRGLSGIRAAGREALGVQPAAQSSAPGSPGAAAPSPAPAAAVGQTPGRGVPGWRKSGIGAEGQGGDIVMRPGAGGVYEFTNDAATPGSVASAGAPASGRGFGVPGRGTATNLGNGVGTFSQNEAGTAKLAYERNERAIQERDKMIATSRRGQIGEGGGRVTVVRDSARTPSLKERQLSRLDERLANTEATRAQTQQNQQRTQKQLASEGLNQQRTQQQIAEGQLAMQDRQRIDALREQLNDPNLSEQQRAAALESYNALAITPDERLRVEQEGVSQQQRLISDLYKSFSGLQERPMTGPEGGRREMSFDEWLQPALQAIQGGQSVQTASTQAPEIGTKKGDYRFTGGDPASPSSWQRV